MSMLLNGNVIETSNSNGARGGTELMRDRLIAHVDEFLLRDVAIHFSRVRNFNKNIKNIYYAHDMENDPECVVLKDHHKFNAIVFVSYWQRDRFIDKFGIPYDKCHVIENAVELESIKRNKKFDTINLVYHTTPHRGLALLQPIWKELRDEFGSKITLDIFSSFNVYGRQDDESVKKTLAHLSDMDGVKSHGFVSNPNLMKHLVEKANIFVYPCIWHETSCIAMIEAMKAGCFVVHPNFGALTETGMNLPQSKTYPMSQTIDIIVKKCINATADVIQSIINDSSYLDLATTKTPDKYDIANFKKSWEELLIKI